VRSPLDFVRQLAREPSRAWKSVYIVAVLAVFGLAAVRRLALPLIPILDIDSANFLWPALLQLNGAGFVHNAGLNFIYPGFLLLLLRAFADFRAIVVAQHLIGLAGGVFFLLSWNRLHDLDVASRLRRPIHQAIGLFGAGIYLLSPTPILFEQQIRSEALCQSVQLLCFWLFFQFLFYRRAQAERRRILLYGLGCIASALLLYSLKPSFTLTAFFTIALVLVLAVRKFRALFFAGAFSVALVFLLPEYWLSRNDRLSKMFLSETLFSVHANIIHDQMSADLAQGVETPFPQTWLRAACDDLGAEINRLRIPEPRQFSLLGFDPDNLMNGGNAVVTRWLQQLGGDAELKRFLDYYFWRAVRHQPLAFAAKIHRQLGVFYSSPCPAFTTYSRIALVAWHYEASLAVIRDPENWEQLGKLPAGQRLLSATQEITAHETYFDSGKRLFLCHSILARVYLPLLVISIGLALWAIAFQKLPAAEKWPAFLVILLFVVNFGNVLATSAVHSMEVQRYSTVQFAAALFAELWAIRYLIGFILIRYRGGRSVRHPRQA
jgi:hypothetical protein